MVPIAIVLFVAISRFIHIDMDKAIARISNKNTEFCCRFIHVRRDILLSESGSTIIEHDNRSSNINKSKSTVDIMGAITLSLTVISFITHTKSRKRRIDKNRLITEKRMEGNLAQ